ncbi:MAG: iron-containing alcohol dehydrogenase [bacterium]|nr:iron-containing alcohol dehydrogenase [bacterium]
MNNRNLPELEYGPFAALSEPRPVTVVTSDGAWRAVKDLLNLNVEARLHINEASEDHWQGRSRRVKGEAIYAVGTGVAVDAAKFMAKEHGLPLIALPTALSVDAFFNWTSALRVSGRVVHVETTAPEKVVIDFNVIGQAPAGVAAGGICDVLSIATACYDWKLAEDQNQNPAHLVFDPAAAQEAQIILQDVLDCAQAAGQGDHQGLNQLLNCLLREVELCNRIGHARPQEGSEHYLAASLEANTSGKPTHSSLIGPSIVLIAAIQGQDTARLKRALHDAHVPLDAIPRQTLFDTLRELGSYVRYHNLPYGVAHQLTDADLHHLAVLD